MNNEAPKLCGICGVELNFTRRDLQKINQLMRQELNGKYFVPEQMVLDLFYPIAHKLHTERK